MNKNFKVTYKGVTYKVKAADHKSAADIVIKGVINKESKVK